MPPMHLRVTPTGALVASVSARMSSPRRPGRPSSTPPAWPQMLRRRSALCRATHCACCCNALAVWLAAGSAACLALIGWYLPRDEMAGEDGQQVAGLMWLYLPRRMHSANAVSALAAPSATCATTRQSQPSKLGAPQVVQAMCADACDLVNSAPACPTILGLCSTPCPLNCCACLLCRLWRRSTS